MKKKLFSIVILCMMKIFPVIAQSPCSVNGDLELGIFTSNWQGSTSPSASFSTIPASLTPLGPLATSSYFAITSSTSGMDPNGAPISQNDPLAPGSYSLLVNSNAAIVGSARAVYEFVVPNDHFQFQYDYACVNSNDHETDTKDHVSSVFVVKVTDLTNTSIDLSCAGVRTNSGIPFTCSSAGTGISYVYTPWTRKNVDLTGLNGHNIRIEFMSSDPGHPWSTYVYGSSWWGLGYAYVNINCDQKIPTEVHFCKETTSSGVLTMPGGYSSYQWYQMPGLVALTGETSPTLTISVPSTTADYVCGVAVSGGCPEYFQYHVVGDVTPNAGIIMGSSDICGVGSYTHLTNMGGDPGGNWTSSDNTIAEPMLTGTTWADVQGYSVGAATISYTVKNKCGVSVSTFDVNVYDATEWLYIGNEPEVLCPGTTYCYYIFGTAGDIVSYTYVNSDGVGISAIITLDGTGTGRVYITPPIAGTVTFAINNVTSGPCTFTMLITSTMTVLPVPVPGIIMPADICGIGGTTNVTVVGGTPGGIWGTSDLTIASPTSLSTDHLIATYIGNNSGYVFVNCDVSNACGFATSSGYITVYDGTGYISIIEGDPDYLCTGDLYRYIIRGTPFGTVGYTITYSGGGPSLSGLVTINALGDGYVYTTPSVPGSVTLVLNGITVGPCYFPLLSTMTMPVIDCHNVAKGNPGSQVNGMIEAKGESYVVSPNPNNGTFTIQQGQPTDGSTLVKVSNAVGQVVFENTILFINGTSQISLDNIASGVYFVEVMVGNGQRSVIKMIKK